MRAVFLLVVLVLAVAVVEVFAKQNVKIRVERSKKTKLMAKNKEALAVILKGVFDKCYEETGYAVMAKNPKEYNLSYFDVAGNMSICEATKLFLNKTEGPLPVFGNVIDDWIQQLRSLAIRFPSADMRTPWNAGMENYVHKMALEYLERNTDIYIFTHVYGYHRSLIKKASTHRK